MAATEAELGTLIEAVDAHYAWMLGEIPSPFPNLRLPHDGVDSPGILRLLRTMTNRLADAGCRGSWLIVAENEVVGLCGYKQPPSAEGKVEIGYGIAMGRRDRGLCLTRRGGHVGPCAPRPGNFCGHRRNRRCQYCFAARPGAKWL